MVVRVLQWMSAHQVAHPTSYRKLTMRTVVLKQGRETARGDDKSTLSPSSGIQLPWGQTREEWGGEASPMHPCLTWPSSLPSKGEARRPHRESSKPPATGSPQHVAVRRQHRGTWDQGEPCTLTHIPSSFPLCFKPMGDKGNE